jgi:hypothetical protein
MEDILHISKTSFLSVSSLVSSIQSLVLILFLSFIVFCLLASLLQISSLYLIRISLYVTDIVNLVWKLDTANTSALKRDLTIVRGKPNTL